jgi:polyisoprenoid-binding protein YceI
MTTTTSLSELTGDYQLDTARTRIGFAASSVLAKVRGQFGAFEGSAHLDGADPSRSSVRLTIAATSIETGNQQRDGHLRSHFLDTGRHPVITFTSTGVERVAETSFRLTGDLTIRRVTSPVTLDLELTGAENAQVRLAGKARINRKDWGVSWPAVLGTVSRQVALELDVAATRHPLSTRTTRVLRPARR